MLISYVPAPPAFIGKSIITPGRTCHSVMNKHKHYFLSLLLEPNNVPVGRLVAPGNSEGLTEGLMLVAGTSILSSVTAGSLSMVSIASASATER